MIIDLYLAWAYRKAYGRTDDAGQGLINRTPMGKDRLFGNGKICYVEMPATDIAPRARFIRKLFLAGTSENVRCKLAFDTPWGKSVARG